MKLTRKLLTTVAVIGASLVSSAASAVPLLFSFKYFSGPIADFSFVATSDPTAVVLPYGTFETNIYYPTGSFSGAKPEVYFYDAADSGGMLSGAFSLFGPQLFTGTLAHPHFSASSFVLDDYDGTPLGKLTITSAGDLAGVPEPATWTMMIVGIGAMGYRMRRRTLGATLVRA